MSGEDRKVARAMQAPAGSGRGSSMCGGCSERVDADAPVTRRLTRYLPWLAATPTGQVLPTLMAKDRKRWSASLGLALALAGCGSGYDELSSYRYRAGLDPFAPSLSSIDFHPEHGLIRRWAQDAAALLVTAAIPVLAGCAAGEEAPSYRYRMTVEVDTPAGLCSGSGVIEVQPRLKGEHAADMAIDGEAVPIDLPNGRSVYASLRSRLSLDWAGWIVLWLVRTPATRDATMADVVRTVAATRTSLVLPHRFPAGAGYPLTGEDALPDFITFEDEHRSETIHFVDSTISAAA